MSDNLIMTTKKAGDGRTLAIINGKLYTLLAGYDDYRAGGWFFLAVAGLTPLKADDLDQHWKVIKNGPVTLAFAQRPFSYHLAQSEGSEPPHGCDWPRLKSAPYHYAFVAPTAEAVETQVRLALEQFQTDLCPDDVVDRAIRVPDETGRGPDALLIHI
jgi:hypothetical protein